MRVFVIVSLVVIVAASAYLGLTLVRMYRARRRQERLDQLVQMNLGDLSPEGRTEALLELERRERLRQKAAEQEAIRSILNKPEEDT